MSQNSYQPKMVSIVGKKASATVMVRDLITTKAHGDCILFLTAYGPTQEIRCFAQLLFDGEVLSSDNVTIRSAKPRQGSVFKIIPNLEHGYSAMYLYPTGCEYIIADTDEEVLTIFSRVLDQKYFVHRSWYEEIAKLILPLTPIAGNKKCFMVADNLAEEVANRVKYGGLQFPTVTATLAVEMANKTEASVSS